MNVIQHKLHDDLINSPLLIGIKIDLILKVVKYGIKLFS